MDIFRDKILEGKKVLISGGGTGLGREIGIGIGRLGAKVAIVGRREDVLKETVDDMHDLGIDAIYSRCDIRDAEQVKDSVNYFLEQFGEINTLVNNAAGNFISKTESLSLNAFNSIIGIVLLGTINLTMDLGKRWIEKKKRGTVINISTIYGTTGSAYVVPSAIGKSGVLALTKSLAAEWGKYGIRHIAIAPGIVPTEGAMSRLAPTKEISDSLLKRVPLGTFGTPQELVNLAIFLISDACTYINGDIIKYDGGESLWLAGQFNFLDMLTDEEWRSIRELKK
jgi:NAD(P)-dependent dehydrogenase (short-subunit alcohol dehydrogenase family)